MSMHDNNNYVGIQSKINGIIMHTAILAMQKTCMHMPGQNINVIYDSLTPVMTVTAQLFSIY